MHPFSIPKSQQRMHSSPNIKIGQELEDEKKHAQQSVKNWTHILFNPIQNAQHHHLHLPRSSSSSFQCSNTTPPEARNPMWEWISIPMWQYLLPHRRNLSFRSWKYMFCTHRTSTAEMQPPSGLDSQPLCNGNIALISKAASGSTYKQPSEPTSRGLICESGRCVELPEENAFQSHVGETWFHEDKIVTFWDIWTFLYAYELSLSFLHFVLLCSNWNESLPPRNLSYHSKKWSCGIWQPRLSAPHHRICSTNPRNLLWPKVRCLVQLIIRTMCKPSS